LDLGTTSQTVGAVTLGGGTISNGTLTGTSYTSTGGTVNAVLAGPGIVFTNTSGTTTLNGVNTYTGGTVVNGGTLVASSASLPANQGVAINTGGTLAFNQNADGTFGGNITGGGPIEKLGSGALTLTQTTTSPVDIRAGSLFTNGGIGTTNVFAGGLLGGNGTVNGNLTNSGIVSPGYSPGTIHVTGNYLQNASGILLIQLASASSYDQLVVTGTATLGGTLQVDTLGGYKPGIGVPFPVLTAAGGVNGKFGALTGSATNTYGAAVAATVTNSANVATFELVQLPFAGFALTPNQQAVAAAAQASPSLTAALDAVPLASQFPAALNALSPQGYEIWSDIAFDHATALTTRLARDDGATLGHDNFYFDASQRRSRARADLDVGSNVFTSSAFLVGGDHVMDPNLTLGGFFEYGQTHAGLGSPGSRTTLKDKTIGARAVWTQDKWYALGVVGYSFDDYNSTRNIVFPGTTAVAGSSTSGHQWFADLTLGRHFTSGAVTISPFVGVLMSRWHADSFTETGAGVFDATLYGQSAHSLSTQAGLEGSTDWSIFSLVVRPHFRAAWLSELENGSRTISAAFGPVNYGVKTRGPQRDSALLSAGLDVVLSPAILLYSDLTTQTGGVTKFLGEWRVGLSARF
ncbi:MAG: autotransporter domain-containing protein, partial [Opitutales bacterium]